MVSLEFAPYQRVIASRRLVAAWQSLGNCKGLLTIMAGAIIKLEFNKI